MNFRKTSIIHAPAGTVFGFHERADAFERLLPPWQKTRVIRPPSSLEVGTVVEMRVKVGPLWQTIIAEHVEYQPGVMFADRMTKGPFKTWLHRHIVEARGEESCALIDDVEYELPFGALGRLGAGSLVARDLRRLFNYRHQVTAEFCESQYLQNVNG